MANRRIVLSGPARKAYAKPVNGRGGHQTLIRRLQKQIDNGILTVSDADIEKIARYAAMYGGGGFQDRFGAASGRPRKRTAKKR